MARLGWIGSWIGEWVGGWLGNEAAPAADAGDACWIVIVEGVPDLLTEGDVAEALVAHPDFDTGVGHCLTVDAIFEQAIDLEDPFKVGGHASIAFTPGIDETGVMTDRVGVMFHRGQSGARSPLTTALTRVAAGSVVAASNVAFPTAPSVINLGTERIEYSAKSGSTIFTVGTDGRGTKVPFGRDNATRRFARHHRVGFFDYQVPMETLVKEHPSDWKNRDVGLFLHHRVGGVLETRDEVVAAGRFWSFRIAGDIVTGKNGETIIPLQNEIDAIAKTTVFRDPWKAKVKDGIYIDTGDDPEHKITVTDVGGTATLTFDSSTEGTYSAGQILSMLNENLADALGASDIDGAYNWQIPSVGDPAQCTWKVAGTPGTPTTWTLTTTMRIARFLGLTNLGGDAPFTVSVTGSEGVENGGGEPFRAPETPYRVLLTRHTVALFDHTIEIGDVKGTLRDQRLSLPSWAVGHSVDIPNSSEDPADYSWAVLVVDNAFAITAAALTADDPEFERLKFVVPTPLPGPDPSGMPAVFDYYGRREGEEGDIELRQVIAIEGPAGVVLPALFYSTGTAGYNHADHDVYPYGVGLGLAHEKLGDNFINSCTSLAGAHAPLTIIIDKPIQFSELIESDLTIRRAHLVWRGGLRLVSPTTPTASQAIHTLTHASKAAPVDSDDDHVSDSRQSNQWAMPIVKFRYNRSIKTGEYLDEFINEAPSAIDDGAGAGAETWEIDCRNVYTNDVGFLGLLAQWLPYQAMFVKPIQIVERSISPEFYFDMGAGDHVLLTDDDVRNPLTGEMGVTLYPAIVLSHTWSDVIQLPGDDASEAPMGRVTMALLATDRIATYGPCAEFEGTDYDDGTNTITCQPHAHSAATASVDASNFDENGAVLIVVEVDPPDPATPLTWSRPVVGVSGNDIEHDGDPLGTGGGEDPFDDTKTYRVIFAYYVDATATQRTKAFQADNADALIQDLASPFVYGNPSFFGTYTEDTSLTTFERHADLATLEGASRDTGYERGHLRNVQTLIDRKCTVQVPSLDLTEIDPSGSISGSQWYAARQCRVFVGRRRIYSTIECYLYASASLRPTTAGAKNWRISLCSRPLNGQSLIDVQLQGLIAQVSGVTDGTTNIQIPDIDEGQHGATEHGMNLRIVPHDVGDRSGIAYLILEVQDNLATRGIAHCYVGPREET